MASERHVAWAANRRLPGWTEALAHTIRRIRAANETERSTYAFQQWLWDDNSVSAVGQGTVPMHRALEDSRFRQWLASTSMEPLPVSPEGQLLFLTALYENTKRQLEPLSIELRS